ncbi:MAG: septum site determining protein [Marmoricola sp.]|nr:septum site determining protein [Marmoricola sp.]
MTERSAALLLATADDHLIDELVRLAAAAGVVPDIVRDVGSALHGWAAASVVLVGTDLAGLLADARPQRRSQVHLVATGAVDGTAFRDALGCGADSVVVLPTGAESLVDLLTDAADGGGAAGRIVGVIGGAGGVGSTIFATALAQVLAERAPTLLVDADVAGAGIDRVLGTEEAVGTRWDGLAMAAGRLSARSLRDALPSRAGLSVLTWPLDRSAGLPVAALREALSAGSRGYRSVVVDLPRHPDPTIGEVLARCDRIVLVTTATVPALTAAVRVAQRLPVGRSRVVLRSGGGGVSATDVERLLGSPVLASMKDQRGVDEAISLGIGPVRSRRGPLARTARRVADRLGGDSA